MGAPIAHFRRRWLVVYLAATLFLTVAGAWVIVALWPGAVGVDLWTTSPAGTIGAVAVAVGGAFTALVVGLLARRGPALELDDEGLLLHGLAWASPCQIRWEELESIRIRPDVLAQHPLRYREPHLTLELRDVDDFLAGPGPGFVLRCAVRANRFLRQPELAYGESMLREPLAEVVARLEAELACRRPPEPA